MADFFRTGTDISNLPTDSSGQPVAPGFGPRPGSLMGILQGHQQSKDYAAARDDFSSVAPALTEQIDAAAENMQRGDPQSAAAGQAGFNAAARVLSTQWYELQQKYGTLAANAVVQPGFHTLMFRAQMAAQQGPGGAGAALQAGTMYDPSMDATKLSKVLQQSGAASASSDAASTSRIHGGLYQAQTEDLRATQPARIGWLQSQAGAKTALTPAEQGKLEAETRLANTKAAAGPGIGKARPSAAGIGALTRELDAAQDVMKTMGAASDEQITGQMQARLDSVNTDLAREGDPNRLQFQKVGDRWIAAPVPVAQPQPAGAPPVPQAEPLVPRAFGGAAPMAATPQAPEASPGVPAQPLPGAGSAAAPSGRPSDVNDLSKLLPPAIYQALTQHKAVPRSAVMAALAQAGVTDPAQVSQLMRAAEAQFPPTAAGQ